MFGDEKNLKDSSTNNLGISIKDTSTPITYTKTNKLITALYMVTDIIDKAEPLRTKLRTLGTGIVSDTHNTPANALGKIAEIMSFLDIASSINIISEMNTNILRKEFNALNQSILESVEGFKSFDQHVDLSRLFQEEPLERKFFPRNKYVPEHQPKGHASPTRIGVQKGSTLMKALSDRTRGMSDTQSFPNTTNFDILKKQRREEITKIIEKNVGGISIKDIVLAIRNLGEGMGEKTLQRELISMVKDGVLNKTGEKRWSRYFLV